MSRIITNVLTAPVPGVWQRLAALQASVPDRSLVGVSRLMETLGVPRDQRAIVHALQSWERHGVPTSVGFALWLLRERQDPDGAFRKRPDSAFPEAAPTLRYVQLALAAGETVESDPSLRRALSWLDGLLMENGDLPDFPAASEGELGGMARVLREIANVPSPQCRDMADALEAAIVRSAEPVANGRAWRTQPSAPHVVTGASALAITALCERPGHDSLIADSVRWLLSVQNTDGGWGEVPSDTGSAPSSVSSTFLVVRGLASAERCGISVPGAAASVRRARDWWSRDFLDGWKRRSISEQAFGLRLGVLLDQQPSAPCSELARELERQASNGWTRSCDLYMSVELPAIALIEWATHQPAGLDARHHRIPTVPPAFLRTNAQIYDVLFSFGRTAPWIRFVDRLIGIGLAEAVLGALLGSVATLAVADERLLGPLAQPQLQVASTVGVAMVLIGWIAWASLRIAVRATRSRALVGIACAGLAGVILTTWTFSSYGPPHRVGWVLVWLTNFLVIDIVSYSADHAGLVKRLLPEA